MGVYESAEAPEVLCTWSTHSYWHPCRVMLLNKWWKACSEILAKGRVRARQLEEQLWIQRKMAVKVSPALHIMDQYGRVVHPEDIDLQLPEV